MNSYMKLMTISRLRCKIYGGRAENVTREEILPQVSSAFSQLIIILPLFHTHLSQPSEVGDSPDHAEL
jgi:hypothetical protein